MKKKALLLGSIFGGIIVSGAWLYATPYLAVRGMRAAAEARDAAALSAYVDFPAVRESVKTSFAGKVAAVAAPVQDNPLAAFGVAIAGAFANPMIDVLVTPEGLSQLLRGDVPARAASAVQAAAPGTELETTTGYDGPSAFVLTVKLKGTSNAPITFVMNRRGLVSWKLTGVKLP
jgi:Protein of unknown function (DUF2939)